MSDVKLGQLATDGMHRDAIHVAVAPVVAGQYLLPGDHVGLDEYGVAFKYNDDADGGKCIGIVDPFLRDAVQRGQTFWVLLYPHTVTGLRHSWEHAAFKSEPAPTPQAQSGTRDFLCDSCPEWGYQD